MRVCWVLVFAILCACLATAPDVLFAAGPVQSTAAAPSLTEGTANSFSGDLSGNTRVSLGSLLGGEHVDATEANGYIRTVGGIVRTVNLMTGVTTNTTSAATTVFSGGKTPYATVTGTGAVTATVSFYGDNDTTATLGEHICTIVLSGTTTDIKYCPQFSNDYPYYYVVTTAVTGTGATVTADMAVGIAGGQPYIQFQPSGIKVADALIKTGPGFLQCIIIAQNDAAPTAGTISVNDAVSAGTGTALFTWVLTTAVFNPLQICPQIPFTTGLYFDFTTTGDVNVSASYK